MTYAEFKQDIIAKSSNRTTTDSFINSNNIDNKVYTAMMWVARKTLVMELVDEGYEKSMRTVGGLKMRYPIKPTSDEEVIVFDDDLIDAVAYHVLAGIEITKAKVYMGMAREIISDRSVGIVNELIGEGNTVTDADDLIGVISSTGTSVVP
jgi:hypothetical protein